MTMTSDALPNFATGADDFAGPPPAMGFFSPQNLEDALILCVPKEFVPNMVFTFGTKDATISAIWVLAGEGAGAEWPRAEVCGVMMAGQLAARIGGKVLGRIAKRGKAYVIASPSTEDKALASTWMAAGDNRRKVERAIADAQAAQDQPRTASQAAPASTGLPAAPPVTRTDEPPF